MKPNTPKRPSVHWIVPVLAAAALALTASPALALIACEDCGPGEPLTRCAGFCNGIPVWFCGDWYFLGCGNWIAPGEPMTLEQAEERFIRSLQVGPVVGEVAETGLGIECTGAFASSELGGARR